MRINKNRRFSKQIVLYLFTSIFLFAAVVSIWLGIIYYFDDGMTYRLSEYMVSGNEEMVREYLLEYRGEADGHNDAINFLAWGISHQNDFIKIVEGVDSTQKVHLCERIGLPQRILVRWMNSRLHSETMTLIRSDIIRHNEYLQRLTKNENK